MNKTQDVKNLLLDSANKAQENGHRLLGRADGIRDVVKFFEDNNFQIIAPDPVEKKDEGEKK